MNSMLEEKRTRKYHIRVLEEILYNSNSHSRELASSYTGVPSPPSSCKVRMTQFSQHILS